MDLSMYLEADSCRPQADIAAVVAYVAAADDRDAGNEDDGGMDRELAVAALRMMDGM